MTCGGQLGAIQTKGTCWFYSILNGFILSEDGQKILYAKMQEFYKKLGAKEKAFFDDGANAPCPLKNVAKTRQIYFWKFIDQYLCFMSGPRATSLKAGRSANLLQAMSLVGTAAREQGGLMGAYPQKEIVNILEHVGFKKYGRFGRGDFYTMSPLGKFDKRQKPKFVIVMIPGYMNYNIPGAILNDPDYALMCSSMVMGNTKANSSELHKYHAVAGFTCENKGYIYDSNQRKVFKCDYWNWPELKKTLDKEVGAYYDFFKNGQIDYYSFSFHVFARKGYTATIAPACRLKYRVKTPNVPGINFTSPTLGERLNTYSWLTEAQRVALKRRWARTKHRNVVYINQAALNSVLNSAKNYKNGINSLDTLLNSGYNIDMQAYVRFTNKLKQKFAAKKLTFEELKARLNQFTKSSAAVRKHQYSLVWRDYPMSQRKVLMHWRNKGEWPKSPSPVKPVKPVNNFERYWTGLTSENRKTIRNYISRYRSPSQAKTPALNAAKRNVNGLKTAKARKEYLRKRAVNMNQENWTKLRWYINTKNMEAQQARKEKRAKK